MTTKQMVCGYFDFLTPIACYGSVCNKNYEIIIDGIACKMLFPTYPEEYEWTSNRQLISPYKTIPFYQDKERTKLFDWGEVYDYGTKIVIIKKAIIELEMEEEDLLEISKRIHLGFNEWIQLFDSYMKLISKQGTSKTPSVKNQINIHMYKYESECLNLIDNKIPQEITLHGDSYGKTIDESSIGLICDLVSLGKQPKLEYIMLLEAYKARSKSDNRKAIIEAASSLEICITNRISEEFESRNIEFGDELLKKFPMLGKRFELCTILEIQLPTNDYRSLIIEPRNRVVHNSYFPTNNETDRLIAEVEKYLSEFSQNLYQE